MLKKLVVIGAVGYGIYKLTPKLVRIPNMAFLHTLDPDKELSRKGKIAQKIVVMFPYSGFCEITGCRTEVHATRPDTFAQMMSEHLDKGHP